MANLSDIRQGIFGNDDAKRIVIKVNTEILDPRDYRASANSLASEIFPEWESDSRILFLAIDVLGGCLPLLPNGGRLILIVGNENSQLSPSTITITK